MSLQSHFWESLAAIGSIGDVCRSFDPLGFQRRHFVVGHARSSDGLCPAPPSAAPACIGQPPSLQQIDAALAAADLPPDQLVRARKLRELLKSGDASESRRAFY